MKTSFCLSTTYIEKSIVKCEEPLIISLFYPYLKFPIYKVLIY